MQSPDDGRPARWLESPVILFSVCGQSTPGHVIA